jgi:hypothetical protein
MGGVVQAIAKPLGLAKSESSAAQAPAAQAVESQIDKKAEAKASRVDEEQSARMRGAKRRGRQLLSDARLNPEMGMKETLGSNQSL